MKSILILFILLFPIASYGQTSFMGNVVNSEDQQAIPDVTVKYGTMGVVTDKNGKFVIGNPEYPMILEISHLAYHPKKVIVRSPGETGIEIIMTPKSLNIDQVQIVGEDITRFFPRTYYYILDYYVFDDRILTIGYGSNQLSKGQLVLTSFNNDTLDQVQVKRPKKLFQDGFGNLHLYASDSVYQLYIENNEVHLLYPTGESDFSRNLLLFQFAHNDKYIFRMNNGDGQANEYFAIDRNTNERTDIAVVYREDLFDSVEQAKRYVNWNPDLRGRMSANEDAVMAARDLYEDFVYDRFIIHRTVTSDIFKLGDHIVIFDHINNHILTYDRDLQLKSVIRNKFPGHHQRKKIVIQDPITWKLYWVQYNGSKVELGEIDIQSGGIINWLKTPSLPFIENVTIRDGVVWFLYQPRLGETVRSLYRMNY